MDSQHAQQGKWIGWMILLVILYITFNPIPDSIDDAAVVAIGGIQHSEETVTQHSLIKKFD